MKHKSFEDFILLKEGTDKDWRKHFIQLEKGFIPHDNMQPVVDAFLKSSEIELTSDTSKAPTMPKKSLFLVGGAVRDFLKGKSIKDYDLATNATPEQIAHILHNAGFAMSPDRSGRQGEKLKITFRPKPAEGKSNKLWFIKGRDNSPARKPFVVSAVVNGEEFEIATFRRDAKVTDGAAAVDFVDNPHEDASRRDLTINAMYIELTKPDGENNKLYDPTGKGHHDAKNSIVQTVGKPEDRFQEDKLRIMRTLRFYCRYGKGGLNKETLKAIDKFKHMEGVALERIRDEFLKGLLHKDTDPRCYVNLYRKTGLLGRVFPGMKFESPAGVPVEFRDRADKPLALAWLLQHNSPEEVNQTLSEVRPRGEEMVHTGWESVERKAVVFLLRLKDFNPEQVHQFMTQRRGTGLTNDQIRSWVEMFKDPKTGRNAMGKNWSDRIKAFAGRSPSVKWEDAQKAGLDICPNCSGKGCGFNPMTGEPMCSGKLPPEMRGKAIAGLETQNFLKDLQQGNF